MKILFSILLIFIGTVLLFPQSHITSDSLEKSIKQSFELIKTNPEQAFEEAKKIENQSIKIKNRETEIQAIIIQCIYFRGINDFEKMMSKAKTLEKKSELFKSNIYQLIAKRYLFEAYIFSGLPEKGFKELEIGNELMKKLNKNDSLHIVGKGDFLIAFSNYYSLKNDAENQLNYLRLAGQEFKNMPNAKYKNELLHIHYSNLAAAFNEYNQLDSAKYYTQLSQTYYKNSSQNGTNINNLWVLGNVAMKEKNYEQAIRYFKKAEQLDGYKNHLNIENLYDNLIEAYKKSSKNDSVRIFEAKKDSLKLTITESQNKSLHKLLTEKEQNKNATLLYVFSIIIFVLLIFIYWIIWKNKLLARQEKASLEYLKTVSSNQTRQNYTQLLKMLEDGEPAFMNYFDETFPDFSKRLLEINPLIIQSEIEFCTLLKLKIPTKDIARYKFITPKTVQNKKYLIRKKLNIPKDVDIYQWFNNL